jgi:hypothetical protein
VADGAGDDPMAQGALGQVVGQRQVRIVQHPEDRLPVVEQLDGERAGLFVAMLGIRLDREGIGDEGIGDRPRFPGESSVPAAKKTKERLTFVSKASARHRRRANWLAHQGRAPL